MGELNAVAEPTVHRVELLVDRAGDVVDHLVAQLVCRLRRAFVHLCPQLADAALDVLLVGLPRIANALEADLQFGTVEEVVVRDQFAIRGQPRDRWPCSGAIALVDVRASLTVDVHGHERLANGRDDLGIGEARRHQVAAVLAPRSGDHQQHGAVFAGGTRQGRGLKVLPFQGVSHALAHPIGKTGQSAGVAFVPLAAFFTPASLRAPGCRRYPHLWATHPQMTRLLALAVGGYQSRRAWAGELHRTHSQLRAVPKA